MRKRERMRLARSELWLDLACTAERWARDVDGTGEARPFAQWPADDPHRDLVQRYDLTPADLARALRSLADQCETHARRSGFDEALR